MIVVTSFHETQEGLYSATTSADKRTNTVERTAFISDPLGSKFRVSLKIHPPNADSLGEN